MERISFFLPSLGGGGAERATLTLANGLARRGHRVDLVLASARGPCLADVESAVRVVDLNSRRVAKALWPLTRYLKSESPAAMLSVMSHANVIAILARRLAGVRTRIVVSEHTTTSAAIQRARGCSAHAVYRLMPWLYRKSDAIVAVSGEAARDLERFLRLPRGAAQVIYNPFDLASIACKASEPVSHPWFLPGASRPVILSVGRLTEAKDFSTLIRAFAKVRGCSNARLLILGEGELRSELMELAQSLGLDGDDFQMPGFVRNPYSYLARAALFVLSSRWEGLPGVLIEALACGAPVVSTDCMSGPREILADGHWGRLVPVGDSSALAREICAVLAASRDELPDGRLRANDFEQNHAIDAYLRVFGLSTSAAAGALP